MKEQGKNSNSYLKHMFQWQSCVPCVW